MSARPTTTTVAAEVFAGVWDRLADLGFINAEVDTDTFKDGHATYELEHDSGEDWRIIIERDGSEPADLRDSIEHGFQMSAERNTARERLAEATRTLDAIRELCDEADRKGYADVDTHRIREVLHPADDLVYDHRPIPQLGCNICVCGEPVDQHFTSPAGTETT